MRVEDQYPSTNDTLSGLALPRIAGAQEDLVLNTLVAAEGRIQRGWTDTMYVASDGYVCSLGAIYAAEGWTDTKLSESGIITTERFIEQALSAAAKEAIELLNASAIDLYPASAEWVDTSWAGPMEWVNQEWNGWDEGEYEGRAENNPARLAVLNIYADAIEKRRSGVARA